MQTKNENKKTTLKLEERQSLPLMRSNFIAMAVCGLLIILGFVLMTGSSSTDGVYNPDIFSTRRIVIGPAITFLGFLGMAIAIIVKPKTTDK